MVKLANTYTANAVMDFTINIHDKIIINMVEFKDREHTVSVKHNIDVEDMDYVVWGVLTQPKFSYENRRSTHTRQMRMVSILYLSLVYVMMKLKRTLGLLLLSMALEI